MDTMKELRLDMERFIAQKGLGSLLLTVEGYEFVRQYIELFGERE